MGKKSFSKRNAKKSQAKKALKDAQTASKKESESTPKSLEMWELPPGFPITPEAIDLEIFPKHNQYDRMSNDEKEAFQAYVDFVKAHEQSNSSIHVLKQKHANLKEELSAMRNVLAPAAVVLVLVVKPFFMDRDLTELTFHQLFSSLSNLYECDQGNIVTRHILREFERNLKDVQEQEWFKTNCAPQWHWHEKMDWEEFSKKLVDLAFEMTCNCEYLSETAKALKSMCWDPNLRAPEQTPEEVPKGYWLGKKDGKWVARYWYLMWQVHLF